MMQAVWVRLRRSNERAAGDKACSRALARSNRRAATATEAVAVVQTSATAGRQAVRSSSMPGRAQPSFRPGRSGPSSTQATPMMELHPPSPTVGQEAAVVPAACTGCSSTAGASIASRGRCSGGSDRGMSHVAGLDIGELGVTFSSLPDQPLRVGAVTPGSWADEAGFLPGDEVIEVNGSRTLALSVEAMREAVLERPLRVLLRSISRSTTVSGTSWSSLGSAWSSTSTLSRRSSRSLTDVVEAIQAGPLGIAPERLWVVAPPKPALQGEYRKTEDRLHNGEPIWQQVFGEGRLLSSSSGRWLICESGAKADKDVAQIKSADPHIGKAPNEVSKWAFVCRDESRNWVADMRGLIRVMRDQRAAEWCFMRQEEEAAKSTARAPEKLWVAVPPRPFLQGEYRKVDGRLVNFRPVWKQISGSGWLFGSWNGVSWMICDDEAKLGGTGLPDIQTSDPNEPGLWKHRNLNGGWVMDSIGWIRVSTDRRTLDGLLANYGY